MKVGDKLYFVYRGGSSPGYVEVVKVGRVWAYLSHGYRIDLKTLRADAGEYSSPGTAWHSKEEYDKSVYAATLWRMFRTIVNAVHAHNDFTAKQIIAAAHELGIDLDPKGKQ